MDVTIDVTVELNIYIWYRVLMRRFDAMDRKFDEWRCELASQRGLPPAA